MLLLTCLRLEPIWGLRPYKTLFQLQLFIFKLPIVQAGLNKKYPYFREFIDDLGLDYSEQEYRTRFALYLCGSIYKSIPKRRARGHDIGFISKIMMKPDTSYYFYVSAHQWLTRLHGDIYDIFVIAKHRKERAKEEFGSSEGQGMSVTVARDIQQALFRLRKGEKIEILGDGKRGEHGTLFPFINKTILLQPSFAILTDLSKTIPCFVSIHLCTNGLMQIEYTPFAKPPSEDVTQSEKIQFYLEQYAQYLEKTYLEHPESIQSSNVRRYLRSPLRKEQEITLSDNHKN